MLVRQGFTEWPINYPQALPFLRRRSLSILEGGRYALIVALANRPRSCDCITKDMHYQKSLNSPSHMRRPDLSEPL
jgi:hypothetical protein